MTRALPRRADTMPDPTDTPIYLLQRSARKAAAWVTYSAHLDRATCQAEADEQNRRLGPRPTEAWRCFSVPTTGDLRVILQAHTDYPDGYVPGALIRWLEGER